MITLVITTLLNKPDGSILRRATATVMPVRLNEPHTRSIPSALARHRGPLQSNTASGRWRGARISRSAAGAPRALRAVQA